MSGPRWILRARCRSPRASGRPRSCAARRSSRTSSTRRSSQWVAKRENAVRRWIAAGKLKPIEPKVLFYMIWATTQQYANAAHEMATLNGGQPLDDAAFERAKRQVIETILGGVAARPARADDEGRAPVRSSRAAKEFQRPECPKAQHFINLVHRIYVIFCLMFRPRVAAAARRLRRFSSARPLRPALPAMLSLALCAPPISISSSCPALAASRRRLAEPVAGETLDRPLRPSGRPRRQAARGLDRGGRRGRPRGGGPPSWSGMGPARRRSLRLRRRSGPPTSAAPFWSPRRTSKASDGLRATAGASPARACPGRASRSPAATILEGSYDAIVALARDWGAELIDAGEAGGLDAASGHGPWPEGLMRLAAFIKGIGAGAGALNGG